MKETLPITHFHLGKFETAGGAIMDLRNPDPTKISITDIAIGLSHIVRFGGQIHVPYTVAHHSIIMSYMVPPEYALYALLHDAQEAYIGDVIKPLKEILDPVYGPLEVIWENAISVRFQLQWDKTRKQEIKAWDRYMLEIEHNKVRKGLPLDVAFLNKDTVLPALQNIVSNDTLTSLKSFRNESTARCFVYRFHDILIGYNHNSNE